MLRVSSGIESSELIHQQLKIEQNWNENSLMGSYYLVNTAQTYNIDSYHRVFESGQCRWCEAENWGHTPRSKDTSLPHGSCCAGGPANGQFHEWPQTEDFSL